MGGGPRFVSPIWLVVQALGRVIINLAAHLGVKWHKLYGSRDIVSYPCPLGPTR